MVAPASHGIARAPRYSRIAAEARPRRLRDSHPLRSAVPAPFGWRRTWSLGRGCCRAPTATVQPPPGIGRQATQPGGFGLRAFRSPLLRAWSLFLGVREMFQFPRSPPRRYAFTPGSRGMTPRDCSIRAPSDRRAPAAPRGVSPRGRALRRPHKPGHPPRAFRYSHPGRATRRAHAGQESAPTLGGRHIVILAAGLRSGVPDHRPEHSLVKVPAAPRTRWRVVVRPVRGAGRVDSHAPADAPLVALAPARGRGSSGYWGRGPGGSKRPHGQPGWWPGRVGPTQSLERR